MSELTKTHIEKLVKCFYHKIQKDELLAPIFNDVAQVDWDHHIPLICQFWNSIMLKSQEYHGNAYAKHVFIGKIVKIEDAHFERWLTIFEQEAAKHLPNEAAQTIVNRAKLIASSLKFGMIPSSDAIVR